MYLFLILSYIRFRYNANIAGILSRRAKKRCGIFALCTLLSGAATLPAYSNCGMGGTTYATSLKA